MRGLTVTAKGPSYRSTRRGLDHSITVGGNLLSDGIPVTVVLIFADRSASQPNINRAVINAATI